MKARFLLDREFISLDKPETHSLRIIYQDKFVLGNVKRICRYANKICVLTIASDYLGQPANIPHLNDMFFYWVTYLSHEIKIEEKEIPKTSFADFFLTIPSYCLNDLECILNGEESRYFEKQLAEKFNEKHNLVRVDFRIIKRNPKVNKQKELQNLVGSVNSDSIDMGSLSIWLLDIYGLDNIDLCSEIEPQKFDKNKLIVTQCLQTQEILSIGMAKLNIEYDGKKQFRLEDIANIFKDA